ncbi:hypothetical protein OG563_09470 [Nocardia vinacea]|uniref:Uncharacterized protein n=1 Tax=Nocardia vinacea TaxID=96468 RepID=A0ABZ1YYT2_9NOCA|nr:hypothetical protein [Nocardia vinacea]
MTTAASTDRIRFLRDWGGICVEESGHAVFAVLVGAQIVECFAKPDHGEVRIAEPHSQSAEIAYAGIFAREVFSYGKVPPLSQLREAFRNATSEDRAHFGPAPELPRRVERDIEYAWPKILELAGHLFRHGRADHADVERILGISDTRRLPLVVSMFKARCLW